MSPVPEAVPASAAAALLLRNLHQRIKAAQNTLSLNSRKSGFRRRGEVGVLVKSMMTTGTEAIKQMRVSARVSHSLMPRVWIECV